MLIGLLLVLSSCALDEGQPWGELDRVTLDARTEAPVEDGVAVFRTNLNWEVHVAELEFRDVTDAVVHVAAPGGAGALSFDAANPPPGYTNCHAGHCHLVDNPAIIVDYEDIEAELRASGGATTDFSLLVWAPERGVLSPLSGGTRLRFAECDGPCHLDRGVLSHVEVSVPEVRVRGHAVDLQTRRPRLPEGEDRVDFDFVVHDITLRGELSGRIDRGQSLRHRVEGSIVSSARLFHDLSFESLLDDAPSSDYDLFLAQLLDNLVLHQGIDASRQR